MSAATLRVERLVKEYTVSRALLGRRPDEVFRAVDDVTLEVPAGETLGIVGESGCGKSTLARLLVRLERPTSGSVYFRDDDVFALKANDLQAFRRKVQIVFQDPYSSLNPAMTIGQLVTEPWLIHGTVHRRERRVRGQRLLESVGIDGTYYDRRPSELSGGERQRIGVARALALEPEVIVCDEPASALDVSIQAQVLTLLQDLQSERGLTYVFISHDLSVVRYIAHQVAVMYQGRLVEVGPAADVYEKPQNDYTRTLIDSARRLHGEVEGAWNVRA